MIFSCLISAISNVDLHPICLPWTGKLIIAIHHACPYKLRSRNYIHNCNRKLGSNVVTRINGCSELE